MNRLIITKMKWNERDDRERIFSCLFSEQNLLEVHVIEEEKPSILGNIYIGKVTNIIRNINAAFVEVANNQICYLSLDDATSPIFIHQKQGSKIVIGDEIMVQVTRENVKTKAPVVSCQLNFTGKFIVLTHGNTKLGISKKIEQVEKREWLNRVLQPFQNEEWGLIARTNAMFASETQLLEEVERLKNSYQHLLTTGIHKTCFSLLEQAPTSFLCDIRDCYQDSVDEIVTDQVLFFETMKQYLEIDPEGQKKIRFYEDAMLPLSKLYALEQKIKRAIQQRVWLDSGGYLVIEPTEALTVIDVNTGKAIHGKKKVEETFYKINLEAAIEISKQIRLRNLSGIIIIDFIDLEEKEHQKNLLKKLDSLLKKDPIKTVLVDMTPLHLVEITRKKVRKPLIEQLNE